jgi:signal transduction histidine kinase
MTPMPRTPTGGDVPATDPDQRLALALHELTTPLAAIRLAAPLLRDPDPAVVEEARAIIAQQGERMTAILRKLADALPPPRRRSAGRRDA